MRSPPLPLPPETLSLDPAGGGRAVTATRPEVGAWGWGWWQFFFRPKYFRRRVAMPLAKIIYFRRLMRIGGASSRKGK